MKIPKTIHQIWFQGEEQIPPHLLEYHKTWVSLNPDYDVLIWDQEKLENLINKQEGWIKETYFSYEKMIQKIDFAKYMILYEYGGIYMDMDVKCLQSLNNTPNINDSEIILSYMSTILLQKIVFSFYVKKYVMDDYINNGTIMCVPKSELLLLALKEAHNLKDFTKFILPSMHVLATTGPFCLSIAYLKCNQKCHILDKSYFENCTIFDFNANTCQIPSHAIGLHYYENSWISNNEKFMVKIYNIFVKYWYFFIMGVLLVIFYKRKPLKRSSVKLRK
jgi:mannosyltransferase OCH1-like enzyme